VIVRGGDPASWDLPAAGSAVAIGVFDGVHLGHRAVFDAVCPPPGGAVPTALTFDPNPAEVLGHGPPPAALTTMERRIELMGEAGMEAVAVATFDERLRRLPPEEFVDRYLVEGLRSVVVAVGVGFRFGRDAAGTTGTLETLGASRGFTVRVVPILTIDGVEVRSSTVRAAIERGDVTFAARLLGRPHEIEGVVVPGDGRGRTIGVPTANIDVADRLAVPARGVYAVRVRVRGAWYDGVSNIGSRPTFAGAEEAVEVHLLDHAGDLYGASVRIGFIARLREERRFANVAALVDQIHTDIAAARRVLDAVGS